MDEKPTLLIATLPHNLSGPQLFIAQLMANAKLHAAFQPEIWAVEDIYRGIAGKLRLFRDCQSKAHNREELIVYINQDLSLVTWLALCFRLSGIRKIATHSHVNVFSAPRYAWLRALYRLILNACSPKKIGVSLASAKAMFGKYRADRYIVIPALIDFDALHHSSQTPLPRLSPNFTFACIGRMAEQKNQTLAILAFAELIKSGIKAHLVLLGDGDTEYEKKLIAIIREKSLERHIEIHRATPNIASIYRFQVDALIVPSIFEGQSRVVAEAQFFGLPVATAEGIPDIAFLDKAKAVTDIPLNVESWATVMRDLTQGEPARTGFQLEAAKTSPIAVKNGIEHLVLNLKHW